MRWKDATKSQPKLEGDTVKTSKPLVVWSSISGLHIAKLSYDALAKSGKRSVPLWYGEANVIHGVTHWKEQEAPN